MLEFRSKARSPRNLAERQRMQDGQEEFLMRQLIQSQLKRKLQWAGKGRRFDS